MSRPKIAAIVTEYRKFSHGQHIVDRFLEGYGWEGRHHHPEMDLVSLYVDQKPESDLTAERAKRFPHMQVFPTIADALTLGGSTLAVDGVLLIGEHGDYPRNEKGQRLYPRYEHFRQIVAVFRTTGRSVPVFNDKHLSWHWPWAKEMYDTANELGFALMAGSSLPVTWRIPAVDLPLNSVVEEAVCVAYGGVDSYDFHALETIQCMVERRKGGESGVVHLEAYRGDRFWRAFNEEVWSRDLFESALCRSHTLTPARAGFNHHFPTRDEMRQLVEDPVAYTYTHADGLRSTMILMNGLVRDFNFAARIEGQKEPFSVQMYLPMPPAYTTLANFFSPLTNHIETLFATGASPYPIERTLLTTGLVEAGVESLYRAQTCGAQTSNGQDADGDSALQLKVETPHLSIQYGPVENSTYWRT